MLTGLNALPGTVLCHSTVCKQGRLHVNSRNFLPMLLQSGHDATPYQQRVMGSMAHVKGLLTCHQLGCTVHSKMFYKSGTRVC